MKNTKNNLLQGNNKKWPKISHLQQLVEVAPRKWDLTWWTQSRMTSTSDSKQYKVNTWVSLHSKGNMTSQERGEKCKGISVYIS